MSCDPLHGSYGDPVHQTRPGSLGHETVSNHTHSDPDHIGLQWRCLTAEDGPLCVLLSTMTRVMANRDISWEIIVIRGKRGEL